MQIKQIISARKRRLIAAFSLVEVTISLGVVGTIAGAMLTGIMGGFFTMKMARENLRATQIMLEKVETIRLYTWDEINQTIPTNFIPRSFTNYYDPNGANPTAIAYRGTLSIDPVDATQFASSSYSTNMRQVTVTLNWTTGTIPRTRSFTTLVAKNGLQTYIY